MSMIYKKDQIAAAQVLEFVMREREQSLSPREWQHRLAGYGYCVRDTPEGQIVETLPHRVPVGLLPAIQSQTSAA